MRIFDAGAKLVRITASSKQEAWNLQNIRQELNRRGYHYPLAADVHFNPSIAEMAAPLVEKVRINPGNFAGDDLETPFLKLLDICRQHGTAIRIGVNHGSLSERMLEKYGDTPEGMVESAMEYLRICRRQQFRDVVVSVKSSNTRVMVYANRLLCSRLQAEDMDYPVHLGVTEAGEGEEGRIRSAAGIGTLLQEGIGDTIRVSLTEDPEREVPAAVKLLEAARETGSMVSERYQRGRYQPITYRRRNSESAGLTGGAQVPVVLTRFPEEPLKEELSGSVPDYVFVSDHELINDLPAHHRYILTAESWMLDEYPRETFFPLFSIEEFRDYGKHSEILNFVIVNPAEAPQVHESLKESGHPVCVVYLHDRSATAYQAFIRMIQVEGFTFPVIVMASFHERDREKFWISTATGLARYFLDGNADGIWLDHPFSDNDQLSRTAFKILQATRARMTETEYIACPSCGRTLFDIQDTLRQIKDATSHLKHLKIAVMGCIVNGPGEMADADYGYVGSGKGKISLYRHQEIVKKNIPQQNAVEELLHLIKTNGDWHD
jgi:(E)-4-hydroxy-3-methylbut-2-enyl-diphosphate synthase